MLIKPITYTNFEGETVTTTAYFDLDSLEIMDLLASGFQNKLTRISELSTKSITPTNPEYAAALRDILYAMLDKAYGKREGENFVKSIEVKNPDGSVKTVTAFSTWRNSLPCRTLIDNLVKSYDETAEFIQSIFPQDLMHREEVQNAIKSNQN